MKIPRSACGLKWSRYDNFLRAGTGTLRFYIDQRVNPSAVLRADLTVDRATRTGWNRPRRRVYTFNTIQQAANAACRIVDRAGSRKKLKPKQQTLWDT